VSYSVLEKECELLQMLLEALKLVYGDLWLRLEEQVKNLKF